MALGAMVLSLWMGHSLHARTVNAGDYDLDPQDATPGIQRAIEDCKALGAERLTIPKDTYHFYPDKAVERFVHVSNNDDGLKRIAFSLVGYESLEIDANGSQFIMHGEMLPFDLKDCRNIKLRNFSIDWNKPFYFQGQVEAVHPDKDAFDLRVHDECDYEIVANELIFLEKPGHAKRTWQYRYWPVNIEEWRGWEQNIDWNIWYDPATKTTVRDGRRKRLRSFNEETGQRYHAKEIEPGLVRLFHATPVLPEKGWVIVIKGRKDANRTSPGIHVAGSQDITLEHVTIHHAGGMGFIAEKTENVVLRKVRVKLPKNSNRMVTTTADATHFVNCRGLISFEACFFENMLDDATNVHGIYTRIEEQIDAHTIGVTRVHGQQQGFAFAEPGDRIRLSVSETMEPYAQLTVDSVFEPNSQYLEIRFTEPVDSILQPNSVADNLTWQADMTMRDTVVRRNRARTMLISTGGDVLVENNDFSTCSSVSMLFAGDATFWHESGPVRNVVIRNNRFRDFGLAGRGAPVINFNPEFDFDGAPTHYYHKNIMIEGNEMEVFGRLLVRAKTVDGFHFLNNVIRPSDTYPLSSEEGPVFQFDYSNDIVIRGNRYLWSRPAVVEVDPWTDNVQVHNNEGVVESLIRKNAQK